MHRMPYPALRCIFAHMGPSVPILSESVRYNCVRYKLWIVRQLRG